ncbi:hypothetical protein D9613_012143 [Agrocybe pediades]|uniref:Uncharacterized protein n=1 Tax=Agrocybe pediades TaxID=84607 RepID=A0A8H4R423_9AGAR|nr:hypothetical protein D9613_012143 [Agrocybe pediades]
MPKYNNEVFNSLLEAMVTRYDKDERGVGLQNFLFAPAMEDVCHLLRTHSPRTYRALREYLPMPTERHIQIKEGRQPKFPMEICDRTFTLVETHLKGLGYQGPVSLSCDDTKLFSTFRIYWDSKEKAHFLVGGTEGPIRVLDPDNVQKVVEEAKNLKATKVRLWCLTIPVPKVTPIIVAALSISNSMGVDDLLPLLFRVLDGLIDRGIHVMSYACDGTEVERAIQRAFLEDKAVTKMVKEVENPRPGCKPLSIVYAEYRGDAICMLQDAKHALKTMRNNLFSGARFLVFGNHTMTYENILRIVEGAGSPLFKRDVNKLDRQDDNAAARLFSAEVLQYLADNPEFVGEIVYLLVFGELIDAYQSRNMEYSERLKLILRARYFLDSWEAFLEQCDYCKDYYFISREANDILRIIIDGFLALLYIHRDHLSSSVPLLPWLHSSESCEHVFGEARQVVEDFTFLNLIYMIPKLRLKLHQAVIRGKSSNGKARASGYNHTYFDNEGLDLEALSTFPTDQQIASIAKDAAEEANSLIALLGVSHEILHRPQAAQRYPGLGSWEIKDSPFTQAEDSANGHGEEMDEDSEEESDEEELPTQAEELQALLDKEEDSPISRTDKIDRRCLSLSSAALALLVDDSTTFHDCKAKFASFDDDDPDMDRVIADEYSRIQETRVALSNVRLPPLQIPDEPTRPLGQGPTRNEDLSFKTMIDMRRKHQTKQAARGVCTRTVVRTGARGKLIQELNQALKQAQSDEHAVGTGKGRETRRREPAPGGREGM